MENKLPAVIVLPGDRNTLRVLKSEVGANPHVVTPFVPNLVSLLVETDDRQARGLVTDLLEEYASGSTQRAAEVEAARARYAFTIMEKHFARAGVPMEHHSIPTSWHSFCSIFYLNIIGFLRQQRQTKLLIGLVAELVEGVEAFSGKDYTNNLFVLLVKFGPHYGWLAPLLPASARARIGELEEMLVQQRDEDERLRLDAMYY